MNSTASQIFAERQADCAQACPGCGRPFQVAELRDAWAVWCESGDCKSEKSNDGIERQSLADAVSALVEIVENDLPMHDPEMKRWARGNGEIEE